MIFFILASLCLAVCAGAQANDAQAHDQKPRDNICTGNAKDHPFGCCFDDSNGEGWPNCDTLPACLYSICNSGDGTGLCDIKARSNTTICRPSDPTKGGACDPPEYCNGVDGVCPPDVSKCPVCEPPKVCSTFTLNGVKQCGCSVPCELNTTTWRCSRDDCPYENDTDPNWGCVGKHEYLAQRSIQSCACGTKLCEWKPADYTAANNTCSTDADCTKGGFCVPTTNALILGTGKAGYCGQCTRYDCPTVAAYPNQMRVCVAIGDEDGVVCRCQNKTTV